VPRGDPVHGVGIVRYADAVWSQLVPKSYRPRAGGRRRVRQLLQLLHQLLWTADERRPHRLAPVRVQGRKDLLAAGVENGQSLAAGTGLANRPTDCVKGANAGRRQPEAGAQPPGGRDGDAQAGEGARAESDREQVDPLPAAGGRGRPLDLLQ
jgi:hypothetical protein